jgi:hypothetical protein
MSQDDVATEVLAAEDRRYEALLGPDLPTLEKLFHDRLSYAHSSGVRDTKAEYLEKIESGYYDYARIDHPVERVDVVGDTALVVGRMTADLTVPGHAEDPRRPRARGLDEDHRRLAADRLRLDPTPPYLTVAGLHSGGMFWFTWKTFSGS